MPESSDKFRASNVCSTIIFLWENGGEGWIRTNVGVRQRIYSPPPLATRAPLRIGEHRPIAMSLSCQRAKQQVFMLLV